MNTRPPQGPPAAAAAPPPGRMETTSLLALSIVLAALVSLGDYWTGLEIDFTVFYTIPIIIATWRLGSVAGVSICALSLAGGFWAETHAGWLYRDPWAHFWNPVLHLAYFILVLVVVHRLKLAYQREQMLSREDLLTGLPNGRAFSESADHELRRSRRAGAPLSLIYLDCDNFKSVNDRYGHSSGDSLLCYVGGILKVQVRDSDTPARIGGDEFAILLPEAGEQAVREVADRLKAALEAPAVHGEQGVSVSMGAATFLAPPASVDAMLRTGDALMYEAKAAGKGTIRYGVFKD